MTKVLTMSAILLAFVLPGCGPSEEKATTQEKSVKETVTEQVTETTQKAVEEVKETAQVVADKAAEAEQKAEPVIKEAVADTKEMAAQTTEAAKEMAADAKQATTEAAAATTMAVDKAVESAKQAVSPETVVLEASYGNITFPHKVHAEAYDCTTCHGDGAPASFDLDKETAHALCKDCHKQEGAGPTGCKGCHKK